MRHNWKKALYKAAQELYESEVLDTGMYQLLIGEDLEFSSKQEWIDSKVEEWLQDD